jgi:phage gp46-like protein
MDIALQYNPALRCCDIALNAAGTDFAVDNTPASAMLMSLLADRRAQAGDVLPVLVPDWSEPVSLTARRGYPGDALDATGQLTGSRLWLYDRALADEETRQGVEQAVAQAVQWLETVRGFALTVLVRWVAPQILGYRVQAGNTVVELSQSVGG